MHFLELERIHHKMQVMLFQGKNQMTNTNITIHGQDKDEDQSNRWILKPDAVKLYWRNACIYLVTLALVAYATIVLNSCRPILLPYITNHLIMSILTNHNTCIECIFPLSRIFSTKFRPVNPPKLCYKLEKIDRSSLCGLLGLSNCWGPPNHQFDWHKSKREEKRSRDN